jgi:hypothetical protein
MSDFEKLVCLAIYFLNGQKINKFDVQLSIVFLLTKQLVYLLDQKDNKKQEGSPITHLPAQTHHKRSSHA